MTVVCVNSVYRWWHISTEDACVRLSTHTAGSRTGVLVLDMMPKICASRRIEKTLASPIATGSST